MFAAVLCAGSSLRGGVSSFFGQYSGGNSRCRAEHSGLSFPFFLIGFFFFFFFPPSVGAETKRARGAGPQESGPSEPREFRLAAMIIADRLCPQNPPRPPADPRRSFPSVYLNFWRGRRSPLCRRPTRPTENRGRRLYEPR